MSEPIRCPACGVTTSRDEVLVDPRRADSEAECPACGHEWEHRDPAGPLASRPWTPVGEGLPAENEAVLVAYEVTYRKGFKLLGTGLRIGNRWFTSRDWPVTVSHWMPMPAPPTEEA